MTFSGMSHTNIHMDISQSALISTFLLDIFSFFSPWFDDRFSAGVSMKVPDISLNSERCFKITVRMCARLTYTSISSYI